MYDVVVVKKFTFAMSSPDEFLFWKVDTRRQARKPVNECDYWDSIFETS